MAAIEVKYSCKVCGLQQVSLKVPARDDPDSDIEKWIAATAKLAGNDHMIRSPMCRGKHVDLMIPVGDVNKGYVGHIGKAVKGITDGSK